MKHNVGTGDRIMRVLAASAMLIGSVLAPLPAWLRFSVLGAMGGYLLFTAFAGHCLGYRLMGRSTCALPERGTS